MLDFVLNDLSSVLSLFIYFVYGLFNNPVSSRVTWLIIVTHVLLSLLINELKRVEIIT